MNWLSKKKKNDPVPVSPGEIERYRKRLKEEKLLNELACRYKLTNRGLGMAMRYIFDKECKPNAKYPNCRSVGQCLDYATSHPEDFDYCMRSLINQIPSLTHW